MIVRSLIELSAEGQTFPVGTLFTVEQTYAATYDLHHPETDALLWAVKSEVETVDGEA